MNVGRVIYMDLIQKYYPDCPLHGNVLQICVDYLIYDNVYYSCTTQLLIITRTFNYVKHGPFISHQYKLNVTTHGQCVGGKNHGTAIATHDDGSVENKTIYDNGRVIHFKRGFVDHEFSMTPTNSSISDFKYDIYYSHAIPNKYRILYTLKDGRGTYLFRYGSRLLEYSFISSVFDRNQRSAYRPWGSISLSNRFSICGENLEIGDYATKNLAIWNEFFDIKDGLYKAINGNKEIECSFNNGVLHGKCIFKIGGTLITDAIFINGVPDGKTLIGGVTCNYINGKREGELIKYSAFNNAVILRKSNYVGNKLHGIVTNYDGTEDAKTMSRYTYYRGVLDGPCYFYSYDENSIVSITKCLYVNGRREGLFIYELQEHKHVVEYRGGLKHGMFIKYNKDGAMIYRATYSDNLLNGMVEQWDSIGLLKYTCMFVNGKQEGLKQQYTDGKLVKECFYVNGTLDGNYSEWDTSGFITHKRTYDHGILNGYYLEDGERGHFVTCTYVNGKKHGMETDIFNGNIRLTYYDMGIKLGYEITRPRDRESNGKMKQYNDEGDCVKLILYYDSGNIHRIIEYSNGRIVLYRNYNERNVLVTEYVAATGMLTLLTGADNSPLVKREFVIDQTAMIYISPVDD